MNALNNHIVLILALVCINQPVYAQVSNGEGFEPLEGVDADLMVAKMAHSNVGFSEKFNWNNINPNYNTLDAIKFTNGVELVYKDQVAPEYSARKILIKRPNEKPTVFLEDDHVYINATYPNAANTQMAVVSHNCGGTACGGDTPTYMVIPHDDSVIKFLIGNGKIQLLTNFENKKLVSATAIKAPLGRDEFNSEIFGDIEYVAGKGFVVPGMKNYYRELLNKHPAAFFDNVEARKTLAKLMGLERFRSIRHILSGPGSMQLIYNRYMALTGCMPQNCPYGHAAIVVDTTNDEVWWLSITEDQVDAGGSREIIGKDAHYYDGIFGQIDVGIEHKRITLSTKGTLNLQ